MDLRKLKTENEEQYIWRIGQAKDNGIIDLSWGQIASLLNKELNNEDCDYNESAYRKPYQDAKRFHEAGVFKQYEDDTYLQEIREAKQELRKEKQKVFDERTALNKILREQGRQESTFAIIKRAIDEYVPARFNYTPKGVCESDSDMIIHLTDVHCGVNVESPFNTFNTEVLIQRLHNYLDEIKDIHDTYNAQNGYLILGGDLIHGLIHVNSRIEAKENLVMQIMNITDIISSFIYELSKIFQNVEVHTTAGNHARATANKEECAYGENFDLLVPFACKKELKNVTNVTFVENILGYDIATFVVRGHMVYASHGEKDNSKTVVYNMTKFARKANIPLPDICYLGHRHTNGLTTVDDVKVIESGCVDGMDNFAVDSRLVGTPEQTVTVVTEKKRIKALCDIQLDK